MDLIIQLLCGAIGGNLAGLLLRKFSLGRIWNSVIGILGGGIGGWILGRADFGGTGGGEITISTIAVSIAVGCVGGAVLLVIVGLVRKLASR